MTNSTEQKSFVEDIVNKIGGEILKNTTTGGAGQAKSQIDQRMNAIDEMNKELDNTSTQDTPLIKKIFDK